MKRSINPFLEVKCLKFLLSPLQTLDRLHFSLYVQQCLTVCCTISFF